MEQVAPRLANASKILTVLVAIGTAVNLKLDLLSNSGLSIEEYVGFGLTALLLIISIVSSKERKIPTLSDSPTLEQQLTAMEETPTKSNTSTIPISPAPQKTPLYNLLLITTPIPNPVPMERPTKLE